MRELIRTLEPQLDEAAAEHRYDTVVEQLAECVEPVARFFEDVLVIDPEHLDWTFHRHEMLIRLKRILTRYFDLRELPGQA